MSTPETFLNPQENHVYRELFKTADVDQKSFLAKNEAMLFFSKSGIPFAILEEFWQSVDEGDKNYITEPEFYIALKLIACAQNGVEPNYDIISTQVSMPQFKGIQIQPVGVTISPITAIEREKYIAVFQTCYLVNGLLQGDEARNIFMKSKLPSDKLNWIWMLADTRNSGTLNKTEFIIAMHYISRCMSDPSFILPQTLPSQTYSEAAGRFNTPIHRHNTIKSPVIATRGTIQPIMSPVTSHTTASSFNSRTNTTHSSVSLSPQEMNQYRPYFNELDTDNSGFIDADEAVYFFSHSRLSDAELGLIWEIADSRGLGKLDFHDFCVAMHLINMRKNGERIDIYHTPIQFTPSPTVPNRQLALQQQQAELDHRYELENTLVELKQQVIFQQKALETTQSHHQAEKQSIHQLELEVSHAKHEMEAAQRNAQEQEKLLECEQQKRDELLGHSSSTTQSNTPNTVFLSSLPELTRAPSSFSGSSAMMSPRSDIGSPQVFDPFAGFKKSNGQPAAAAGATAAATANASIPNSKSVSKYGFDLSAFDALSVGDNNTFQKSSVNEDLASLFGSPIISSQTTTTKASDFDNIFM